MRYILICLIATAFAAPRPDVIVEEKKVVEEFVYPNFPNNFPNRVYQPNQYYYPKYWNEQRYVNNFVPEKIIEKVKPITQIVYDPIRQPVQQAIDPMMFLLLADDSSSNKDLLPLMMMMNGGLGGDQNPLLWMTLLDDDETCEKQFSIATGTETAAMPTTQAEALGDVENYHYVWCKQQEAEETGLFGDNKWLMLPFLNGGAGQMDPLMMMLMMKDSSGDNKDLLPLLMMQNGFTNPTSPDQPNPLMWMILLQEEACSIQHKIPTHYWDVTPGTPPTVATKVTDAALVKAFFEVQVPAYKTCLDKDATTDNDFLLPFLLMNNNFNGGFNQFGQGGMDPLMMMMLFKD